MTGIACSAIARIAACAVAKADMKEATNFGGLLGVILLYLEGAPCDRPADITALSPTGRLLLPRRPAIPQRKLGWLNINVI
jgi:hypothetical protein